MDLISYRKSRGMKQADIGALLGVSDVTVHRWEQGKARPKWRHLVRLREATNGAVTPEDFLPRADEQRDAA